MTLKQKAARGLAWSFTQRWGSQFISFSVFMLLARLLRPEEFGLVAMSSVFMAFMKVFLDQGFAPAIIQRKEIDREHLDTAFWVSISTSVVLVAIAWLLAGWVAAFYNEPLLTRVIQLLSLNFIFQSLNSVQSAILTRNLAFKTLAVRSLIGIASGGMVGVVMALNGFGVWSLVGYQLTNNFVEVIVLWTATDWRPGFRCSGKHFREMFNFGIHVMGMHGLIFLNNYSDNLLIGYYLGSTALGYYTVAYRVLTVLSNLLSKTTNQVAFPTFSKLQQEPERLERAYYKATHLTSLLSFPAFLGIVALAPQIIPTLFGDQWLPSIPVMQVLAFMGILRAVFQFNSPIMMAMGRPDWRLQISVINTVFNVLAFIVVVRWGILAVAIALVVRSYLFAPLGLWLIKKLIRINLKTYLQQFKAPLIGSLLMVLVMVGLRELLNPWLIPPVLLTICGGLGASVYALTVLYFEPKLLKELTEIGSFIIPQKRRKKKEKIF